MAHRPIQRVEDYTRPFLVMAFVVLFMGMFMLWAAFGYLASLLSGLFVHVLIGRLPRRD